MHMDTSETSSVVVVLSYEAYDYVLNKYQKNVKFSHFYSSKRRSNINFAISTRRNLPKQEESTKEDNYELLFKQDLRLGRRQI